MAIRVELFGIARQRAGVSEILVQPPLGQPSLANVLQQLAVQLPALGSELIVGGRLHKSLAANLDGVQFISNPETAIRDGQSLLILSADAGG
jgi:sulfur-carrier protein